MLGIHQDVQVIYQKHLIKLCRINYTNFYFPQLKERVYEEVAALYDDLKGREVEAEDLTRFEYTDRVIKETLRLYPVGPVIFRECSATVPLCKFSKN